MKQADLNNIITGPWPRRRLPKRAAAIVSETVLRVVDQGFGPDGRWVARCVVVDPMSNVVSIFRT